MGRRPSNDMGQGRTDLREDFEEVGAKMWVRDIHRVARR